MTVRQLIDILEELPGDSEITDVCGNPVTDVCFEPSEEDPNVLDVWIDTDYIYDK